MTRIRDKHTYYFMFMYYEGYTDTFEEEVSFRAEPYNVILIEGVDYEGDGRVTLTGLSMIAWMQAVNAAHLSVDNVVEIKLMGVDHGTTNI